MSAEIGLESFPANAHTQIWPFFSFTPFIPGVLWVATLSLAAIVFHGGDGCSRGTALGRSFALYMMVSLEASTAMCSCSTAPTTPRQQINPNLIFLACVPILLYETTSTVDMWALQHVLHPALLLAIPGMLLGAAALGLVAWALIPTLSLMQSLLLGSIVAAADPVAVVSVLRELQARKRLSSLLEGEALLSTGPAHTMFMALLQVITNERGSTGGVAGQVLQLSLGGVAVGLVAALATKVALSKIHCLPDVEVPLVLVMVFAMFYVAELGLSVSGVLAAVTFGLCLSASRKLPASHAAEAAHRPIVHFLARCSNLLVFALSAVVMWSHFAKGGGKSAAEWAALGGLYLASHAVRAVVIAACFPCLKRGESGITLKEGMVLSFAGVRGAMALVLALLVANRPGVSPHVAQSLTFHTCGMVILSLFINGTFAAPMFRWLEISPPPRHGAEMTRRCMDLLDAHVRHEPVSVGRGSLARLHFVGADYAFALESILPHIFSAQVSCRGTPRTADFLHLDSIMLNRFGSAPPRNLSEDIDVAVRVLETKLMNAVECEVASMSGVADAASVPPMVGKEGIHPCPPLSASESPACTAKEYLASRQKILTLKSALDLPHASTPTAMAAKLLRAETSSAFQQRVLVAMKQHFEAMCEDYIIGEAAASALADAAGYVEDIFARGKAARPASPPILQVWARLKQHTLKNARVEVALESIFDRNHDDYTPTWSRAVTTVIERARCLLCATVPRHLALGATFNSVRCRLQCLRAYCDFCLSSEILNTALHVGNSADIALLVRQSGLEALAELSTLTRVAPRVVRWVDTLAFATHQCRSALAHLRKCAEQGLVDLGSLGLVKDALVCYMRRMGRCHPQEVPLAMKHCHCRSRSIAPEGAPWPLEATSRSAGTWLHRNSTDLP